MKVELQLVYVYNLNNDYLFCVLVSNVNKKIAYISIHGDPAADLEVMEIFLDGLSYATDIECTDTDINVNIVKDTFEQEAYELILKELFPEGEEQ